MSVRTITYVVGINGISPRIIQKAGIQNEHCACKIVFRFDSSIVNALTNVGNLKYRFDAYDGSGGYHPSEPTDLEDLSVSTKLEYLLQQNVTAAGGTVKVFLVISKKDDEEETELILYSFPAILELENLPYGTKGEKKALQDINSAVTAAQKYSKEAAESKDAAETFAESAENAAVEVNEIKDNLGDMYTAYLNGELKGEKGEKGDKGDTGAQGEKGERGNPGVYVGSGDMPEDCNVQIDPEGEPFSLSGYVKSVNGVTPDANGNITMLSEIINDNAIPEYWLEELETKADTIRTAMETAGRNKSAFLWYTDAHWVNGNSKVSPSLLNYLYLNTPMNKVNFGGDIIGNSLLATRDEMTYLYEWRKAIKDLPNHHSVLGNHDMFSSDSVDYENDNYRYSIMIAPEETPDMVMGEGNYYYIDNPAEKTRYLYLCYLVGNHSKMVAQGKFIVDALLSVAEDWHIVVIGHRWFQYTLVSSPTVGSFPQYETEILKIFDEYNARATHTASNYFSAQDFSGGKGKIEFCIGGHIHYDYDFKTDGGIPVILTTADVNQDRVPDSNVDSGTEGTTTEAAVFGIIADYNEDATKITVVGIGRGTSRVVYQNVEETVVNLFNKDDADLVDTGRFNSSNEVVNYADGQLVTGYIEGKVGDVITLVSDKANNTNGYTGTIMLYDNNKTPIANLSYEATYNGTVVSSDDYKTVVFNIVASYSGKDWDATDTAYVRFCVAYTDIDSIVITKE